MFYQKERKTEIFDFEISNELSKIEFVIFRAARAVKNVTLETLLYLYHSVSMNYRRMLIKLLNIFAKFEVRPPRYFLSLLGI